MSALFGKLKMSWPAVIIFAVIAGVCTGAVMLNDAWADTSIQDIGISYEWWVIFAVIIVVNCHKNWDAMLKCFMFFVISQPLVYAVEILFGNLTVAQGWYYYSAIWLPMTMLTLPGGFIAYYCKKQNFLGALILGIGNTIQGVLGVYYAAQAVANFPNHIVSSIVCFGSIFVMSYQIQKNKLYCLISIAVPVALTIGLAILAAHTGRTLL